MDAAIDPTLLRRFQGEVGDSETCRSIRCGTVGDGASRSSPINRSKFKWDVYFYITAVGSLAVLVSTIIACEIGEPTECCKAEIVADVAFKHVVGTVGLILEVATVGVSTVHSAEPVVGNTDAQSADGVVQRQVELLDIVCIDESVAAPCRQ